MKMKCSVIAALALGVPLSTAHAEFLNRYSQWHDLDKTNKSLYAAGLVGEGHIFNFFNAPLQAVCENAQPKAATLAIRSSGAC